ncbi:hypothetical protein Dimus_020410 [Dionaea muscipula]
MAKSNTSNSMNNASENDPQPQPASDLQTNLPEMHQGHDLSVTSSMDTSAGDLMAMHPTTEASNAAYSCPESGEPEHSPDKDGFQKVINRRQKKSKGLRTNPEHHQDKPGATPSH